MNYRFIRSQDTRRYKKLFLIAAEGHKTERQYFRIIDLIKDENVIVKFVSRKTHASDPPHVLQDLMTEAKKQGMRSGDELWVVIDRDNWTMEQLDEMISWSEIEKNGIVHGLALSHPGFEYWLVLHFEDGAGLTKTDDCTDRLKTYIKYVNKTFPCTDRGFNLESVKQAVHRAQKTKFGKTGQPIATVGTTVFRLVEKLIPGDP
ncbi:MAG: RloB family protein [Planctomycetaceae bacterium]|nr:RloB family protein [Planctomycetaceae bacterium]